MGAWNDSQADIQNALSGTLKNALGIKTPQAPASSSPVYVTAAQNPMTYVMVAGIGILLYILLGRK